VEKNSDSDLVARTRDGDKQAFDQLVTRYERMARRVAMGMVANEDVARDLVQEALLQAYLSLDRLRDEGRFRSWLYGIVLNVCRSYLRDQKGESVSLEDGAGGSRMWESALFGAALNPHELAEERELQRKVLEAVQALPPADRAAVLLFYYQQWSRREIAEAAGVSEAAVKDRLQRVRRRLRERLLPAYPELDGVGRPQRKRNAMVKARVASVFRERTGAKERSWVMLLEETGQQVLPIWIGNAEALAIEIGLEGNATPRPLTFDLMVKMLEATGSEVREVRVEALRENTYFAVVKLRRGKKLTELDARPSDALALAVRLDCPIYVAEEVLREAGVAAPEFARYEIFAPLPFDEAARAALHAAREEAGRFGEHGVGTEHLLLALLRQPDSGGVRLLKRLGLAVERVRAETEQGMSRGEGGEGEELVYTPRCRYAIQLAAIEAGRLSRPSIGCEHLLLGLIGESDGRGGRVLIQLGAEVERARQEVAAMHGG
jgi:RNA polymerase sigma factor (sigma-70 family)